MFDTDSRGFRRSDWWEHIVTLIVVKKMSQTSFQIFEEHLFLAHIAGMLTGAYYHVTHKIAYIFQENKFEQILTSGWQAQLSCEESGQDVFS